MLNLKYVCERFGISRHTIYRLIKSGSLPARRVGRQWRFEVTDIEKLRAPQIPAGDASKPALLSLRETCVFLGLSRSTVCRLVKEGILPAMKPSGQWRLSVPELRQFLSRGRDTPLPPEGMPVIDPGDGALDINEAAQLLGVNRRTVYRLVKEGKLPGAKIASVWRFTRTELNRYLLNKKYYYGTYADKGVFFRPEVLGKYRLDNETSYLRENAYDGFVGRRADYLKLKKMQALPYYKILKRISPPLFAEVHYRKIVVGGGNIVVLTPNQYEHLPPAEHRYWAGYVLSEKQLELLRM